MPETANPKLRAIPPPNFAAATQSPLPYAELDVKTNFSFLRGASHPDELVYRAAELGYRAIAVTDFNSLAGAVRMHEAAREVNLKLLIGARLTFADAPDLLVWAPDRAAYAGLCRLLTLGKRRAEKGQCDLRLEDFLNDNAGLWAGVVYEEEARRHEGPRRYIAGVPGTKARRERQGEESPHFWEHFRNAEHHNYREPHLSPTSCLRAWVPGDVSPGTLVPLCLSSLSSLSPRLSLVVSCGYGADDAGRLQRAAELARRFNIPLLATNDVYYHDPARRPLQDVLTCVRHGCAIHEAGYRLFPNAERYLKSPRQMHRLFADYPQALRRGIEIIEACNFSLDSLRYEYPDELVPPGKTAGEYLAQLTWEGAAQRYPHGVPQKVRAQIEHELKLIAQLNFEPYFLTVYDLVSFARSRGILCQGRGSAANSAVCYCIGVTAVDPDRIDVLFERFISAARNEPPDIDVDFEHERREEVIQYVYQKYGRHRAGMTATVITYRGRSAIRDVGKALGLSLDMVDTMASKLDWWDRGVLDESRIRQCGLDPHDRTIRRVISLATELLGFPRHLSQHVGGMVMTRGPLNEMVPIENATMEGRTVIEWDKDDIDAIGILKVDVLALGMLTCISKAFGMINKRHEGTGPPAINRRGTQARRHEGGEVKEGAKHGADSDVSGFNRLATGDAFGPRYLPDHGADAQNRAIWAYQSDEEGGSFYSLEHCRRVCTSEHCGLSETSSNRPGILGGTKHPTRTVNRTEFPEARPGPGVTIGRNRSSLARTDSESGDEIVGEQAGEGEARRGGEQARRHGGTKARSEIPVDHRSAPSYPSSPPSCLRASVPSCLSSPPPALHTIPPEDPAVYDMIGDADTIGVFQIESRAQMAMLPRLRPRCFYDLVIEVAIVRPGPIQGNMVHPYLKRRAGEEPITFPSEALRQVLRKTLGVPLFQEQAMKIAMVAAGFSAEEADKLRRAMAAWRRSGVLETFQKKIVEGMVANGYDRAFAEQCYQQIKGFGEYGFPESHAASFALLVYVSAWLKRHHPAAFAAALINSQPMGFYQPAQIVRDARDHGVPVRPPDINESGWDCTLEPVAQPPSAVASRSSQCWGTNGPALRLGFRLIKGLPQVQAQRIVESRQQGGRFTSVLDFHARIGLSAPVLRTLAEADAFGSLGLSRRQALWEVLRLGEEQEKARRHEGTQARSEIQVDHRSALSSPSSPSCLRAFVPSCLSSEPPLTLPTMPLGQEVMIDYSTCGLSLKQHPVALVREELTRRNILTSAQLMQTPHGRWVKVAGLVLIRQRPGTAAGIVFETLEDETGIVNLIVKPEIYDFYRPAARHAGLLQADGYVQRSGQIVHVMAKRLHDLSHLLKGYELRSRDFH